MLYPLRKDLERVLEIQIKLRKRRALMSAIDVSSDPHSFK